MRNKEGQTFIEYVADSPLAFAFFLVMTVQGTVLHILVLLHFYMTQQWWALAFFSTLTLFLISCLPALRKFFGSDEQNKNNGER